MNIMGFNTTVIVTEVPDPHELEPFQVIAFVLTALTGVLILTLNPICLVVLHRASGIQETTKVFMASLTVSDICIGLFWMLPQLTQMFAGKWVLGEFLCSAWGVLSVSFLTLTILSLVLLTMDRFIAIVFSLRYPTLMTLKRAQITIAITWALTLVFYIIVLGFYAPSVITKDSRICSKLECVFCLPMLLFVMASALGLVFALYIYILIVARRHARRIAAQNQINHAWGDQNVPQRISTKSATTVFIITMTVFICWSPTIILLEIVKRALLDEYPTNFIQMTNLLFFTNSWLNGVIYYLRNRELRQALHELVTSCFRRRF